MDAPRRSWKRLTVPSFLRFPALVLALLMGGEMWGQISITTNLPAGPVAICGNGGNNSDLVLYVETNDNAGNTFTWVEDDAGTLVTVSSAQGRNSYIVTNANNKDGLK